MMNNIKYAASKYFFYLGAFATIIGIVAIIPIEKCIAIVVIISCYILALIIPLLESIFRCNFELKTIGKSNISFAFGDLFNEKCFVITTNRYFDVEPTGEYIAEGSLLGIFVNKYFPDNVAQLETLISEEISKIQGSNNVAPFDYGTFVKIKYGGKIIYLVVFTDRTKTNQPDDFYEKTIQTFLTKIVNENHGETIAVPLFGDNNNLSDSGFTNSEMAFTSLMAMINNFEIRNQRSEIKIRIVALPEKRAELIKVIQSYSKR